MEDKEKKIMQEKNEEFLGFKLKNLVGKTKGGVHTPPPSWSFEPIIKSPLNNNNNIKSYNCDSNNNNIENNNVSGKNECNVSSLVTARQLGANLWESLAHLNSVDKSMSKGYESGLKMHSVVVGPHDSASDVQTASTGSYHREIASTQLRHHRSANRSGHEIQPVSPANYSNSTEVTPYNPATTPSSSQDFRGRMSEPSYNLKTSTELLKILNRIWCLEEKHASNVSKLKTLKSELDNARTRIKGLLREKQKDRQVMDDLMKQVSEDKFVKRNMEQDQVLSALQSVRQELEDERKLRKRSESLHRKMAREILEMESSFSKALNELERERRARILLEDLCDKFAMGIRDYEQEFRSQKHRSEKEKIHRERVNSLTLHISEAWLDERVQMKLAEEMRKDIGENCMIVDKLRPEIETFLKARRTLDSTEDAVDCHNKTSKGNVICHQSLESFPLNEAMSAPKIVDDEDDNDSVFSESNCFELTKNFGGENSEDSYKNVDSSEQKGLEETVKTAIAKRKVEGQELSNGHSLSSLQARFEKHMARMTLGNGYVQDKARPGNQGRNLNHMLDNLMRNNSSSTEGARIHPESELPDVHSLLPGSTSPVKNWESKTCSQDLNITGSSSNCPRPSKKSTLKARLLEARLEGRKIQSKGSKGAS